MLNIKFIDDLCHKLSNALPENLKDSKEKFEQQIKSILQNTFEKLDLVTRDEFDKQAQYLKNLQAKLAELEAQLDQLAPSKNTAK